MWASSSCASKKEKGVITMFLEINKPTQMARSFTSSHTLQDFKDYIDTQIDGFQWVYISAPAMRAFTGVSNVSAGMGIFLKSNNTVLCEIRSLASNLPVYVLSRYNDVWDESFTPRIGGG